MQSRRTVDNLSTLCLDRIDADKLALKRQIEASLNRLERQNLVSRNGDQWFFLTNEERDVSQEIKSVEVSSAELGRLVAEIVFDEILSGQNKVRHRETKSDYDFNRLLDGAPYKQANHELTFEILSPVGSDYELMSDAKCIGRSAEGVGRAICRMANDARVDVELRTYLQIEKYIGPKTDMATPALKRILFDRKDENRERRKRLVIHLADMFTAGDFFAMGQKPTIKPQSPSIQFDELLTYLVFNTYRKLGYLKVRQTDPSAEIKAVLSSDTMGQQKMADLGEEGNPLAMADMRQYLTLAASNSRVLLSDVVDKFTGAPWGWRPDLEISLLIARLFMAGEIKLVMEGSDLDPASAIEPLIKPARFKNVSILKRKAASAANRAKARDLHRELFSLMAPEDEDALVAAFRENLVKLKGDLERARNKAEQKSFPGLAEITQALATIDTQLAIRDPFEFLAEMLKTRNDWMDLSDDTHDVLSFYKTQAPVWGRLVQALAGFEDNHSELVKEANAAAAMVELDRILANKTPYGQVNRIETLLATVEKVNDALAAERREKALQMIDGKIDEAVQSLDAAQAEPALRNQVLKPLQDLKAQLAGLSSIPRILFLQNRSGDLLDEVMIKLVQAAKAKAPPPPPPTTSGTGTVQPSGVKPPPPAPAVKPIKVIRVADLGGKTYLESENDVEEYLGKLRVELMAAIQAGQKARLQ